MSVNIPDNIPAFTALTFNLNGAVKTFAKEACGLLKGDGSNASGAAADKRT